MESYPFSRKTESVRRGRLLPALLTGAALAAILFLAGPAAAESAPKPPPATGGRATLAVKSLVIERVHAEEDLLVINDHAYVVTPRSRLLDARGKPVSRHKIPVGAVVDLTYNQGSKTEVMPYGPNQRVLIEVRMHAPKREKANAP